LRLTRSRSDKFKWFGEKISINVALETKNRTK
jgi:hypothetical protein